MLRVMSIEGLKKMFPGNLHRLIEAGYGNGRE
jgi:hypothetical protein